MPNYYDLVAAKTMLPYLKLPKDQIPKELWAPDPGLSEEKEWKEIKKHFYGTQMVIITDKGLIDFNPEEVKHIVHGGNMSYSMYLDIAWASREKSRAGFERAYYDAVCALYKGRVDKIKKSGRICFDKIFINGDYGDGTGFVDKEDHVWMQPDGFPELEHGMCVSFLASVHRYLKKDHNGSLMIDYGLGNPESVKIIEDYELPTDDDLLKQEVDRLICENMCTFRDHCNGLFCLANEEWRNDMRAKLYAAVKSERSAKK